METIFSSIITGVHGLIVLCTLFMAFKTRKIKIKGLNDAKYIAAIIYFSCISGILAIIIIFLLPSHVNAFPAANSGGVMLLGTFALGAVFLPKVGNTVNTTSQLFLRFFTQMISLYQDPEGEHVFDYKDMYGQAVHVQLSKVTAPVSTALDCTNCQLLQTQIKSLEDNLAIVSPYYLAFIILLLHVNLCRITKVKGQVVMLKNAMMLFLLKGDIKGNTLCFNNQYTD